MVDECRIALTVALSHPGEGTGKRYTSNVPSPGWERVRVRAIE
jgi:hypothetical protein